MVDGGGVAILNRKAKEHLSDRVTFEQRTGALGAGTMWVSGRTRTLQGTMCKGPGGGQYRQSRSKRENGR